MKSRFVENKTFKLPGGLKVVVTKYSVHVGTISWDRSSCCEELIEMIDGDLATSNCSEPGSAFVAHRSGLWFKNDLVLTWIDAEALLRSLRALKGVRFL